MNDLVVLSAGFGAAVAGIAVAAWILRHEIRWQARQRRHGGYLVGGER